VASPQDGRWLNRLYMRNQDRRDGKEVEFSFAGKVLAVPQGHNLPKGDRICIGKLGPLLCRGPACVSPSPVSTHA
jgi:hypothetical protein